MGKPTKTTNPTAEMMVDPVSLDQPKENNQIPDETSIMTGMNILDLPSEGRLGYPSSVNYRDIMTKDEEVLSSATADTYGRTLNGVVKSLLNDCEFYNKMSIYDR